MKNILFIFCFVFCLFPLNAQNFYQFKWTSKGVKYTGFLIYKNSSDMIMRVAYTTKSNIYKVAEYTCTRKEYKNSKNQKVIQYNGENAKVVYKSKPDNYGYSADNFYFIDVKNNVYQKLYVNDDQKGSIYNTSVSYKKLNPHVDFTKKYLNKFYTSSSPVYKKLLINTITTTENSTTNFISKVRFIAIGDSNRSDLHEAPENDIEAYRVFLKTVSKNLNIPFKENIYMGDKFTKRYAINNINRLKIGNKEIVIFLYRGHGFRWADQRSDFPRMKLGDVFSKESYNIETLYNNLRRNNPRLLIAIGDLCNDSRGLTPITSTTSDPIIQDYSTVLELDKIKALLKSRGSILTVSAKPGEVSHASYEYGFYSKSFLDALKWEISGLNTTKSNWSSILYSANKNANKESLSKANMSQNALTKNNIIH